MATKTKKNQRRIELDLGTERVPDILRDMKFGRMCSTIKATFVGLAAGTVFDLTSATLRDNANTNGLVGFTPDSTVGETLPPADTIQSLRVTAGTATGQRQITDAGGTASTSLAKISDDGKTITFEANVTAFVIIYKPRSAVDLTAYLPET